MARLTRLFLIVAIALTVTATYQSTSGKGRNFDESGDTTTIVL